MDDDEEDIGLADAMLSRGARLRELRAMMEAAEAEENDNATIVHEQQILEDVVDSSRDGRSILRYESYLMHQRYYDDLKHIDHNFIDFGRFGRGNGTLLIEQEKSLGKGGLCWDAAFILGEYMIDQLAAEITPHTRIVELGAGTGLAGLALAKALDCSCHVELTDLPELMDLLQRNIDLNFGNDNTVKRQQLLSPQQQSPKHGDQNAKHEKEIVDNSKTTPYVTAKVLRWGQKEKDYPSGGYDIIMGADVVASLYDPVALADTIWDLSHEGTVVFISYKGRLTGPHTAFEERLKHHFNDFERIESPESRNHNPGVKIIKSSRSI